MVTPAAPGVAPVAEPAPQPGQPWVEPGRNLGSLEEFISTPLNTGVADAPALGAEPAPAAVPTAPSAPSPELTQLQQEKVRLEQELEMRQAQVQAQQVYSEAQRMAQQGAKQLEGQGWDPEHALAYATAYYQQKAAEFQLYNMSKNNAIGQLAQQYGAPKAVLQGYGDYATMEAAAKQYAQTSGPQNKELQDLKRQVAALTKGQVPPQNYAQPGTGAGRVAATRDNIDALYVQWEVDHPGQNGNPYEGQYRKFLGM